MREARLQEIRGAGARLPELALPDARDGTPVSLRAPGRRAPVVVQLDRVVSAAGEEFLQQLAAVGEAITAWDGRVVVVVPDTAEEAARLGERLALPFPVLADPERRLAARTGLDGAGVLIADQWGVLHRVERVGPTDAYPAVSGIVDWLRYLAIQCPECEGEAL